MREGTESKITDDKISTLRKKIPKWLQQNGRNFPWRKTDDSFKLLISEIMLQKTTGEQVAKVYDKFFKKFPSAEEVSEASSEELYELIEELGLKKRAVFIKEISEKIVNEYGGKVVGEERSLKSLKGVGDYTCNAVLCFAFGETVPIVDANIARVYRRYFGLKGGTPAYSDKELWKLAEEVVQDERCGEINLGLIDLAALICTPKNQSCSRCPLSSNCSSVKSVVP